VDQLGDEHGAPDILASPRLSMERAAQVLLETRD
jgi:hypothetical protein